MDRRVLKRIIVAFVFILVVAGLIFAVYALVRTGANCYDGVKNGKEEGVDCGALACGISCPPAISPIQITEQHLVPVRSGEYDFVAKVFNPNTSYGASDVEYELNGGHDSFYILPGQTRYVVLIGLKDNSSGQNLKADMKIKSADWQNVNTNDIPHFSVQSQNFLDKALEATIFNDSHYDFDNVDVSVVLFDAGGNIIGVNKTVIRTFDSKTNRYFKVGWPAGSLVGQPDKINIEPLTNIINNSNFIQNYGNQEKFQAYY